MFSQAIQQAVDVFEQKNKTFKLASKELSSIECVSGVFLKLHFHFLFVCFFFALLS